MKEKLLNIFKIIFAAGLVTAVALNYDTLSNLDVRSLISAAGGTAAAVAVILGVYFIKSLAFVVPASLVYIAVGMAFNTPTAMIINTVGIMIEITATYIMGRFLGKDAVEKKLSSTKAGKKLLSMEQKNKNIAVFVIRFTGIPIDISSLFMGAFDFKFVPYFFLSLAGILPRVLLLTAVGDGFYNLIPMKYLLAAVIVIVPAAVVAAVIKSAVSKKRAVHDSPETSESKNI